MSLTEIAALYDELVTAEEVEDTLVHVVQKLDPPGVGARDLQGVPAAADRRRTRRYRDVLRVLIRNHLEDIAHNRLPVIQKATGFDIPTIKEAIEALAPPQPEAGAEVRRRRARRTSCPTSSSSAPTTASTTSAWSTTGCRTSASASAPSTCIKNKELDAEAKENLRKKLQSAHWLMKAVEQRRNTLMKVTRAIIEHQRAFLDTGPEHIEPLKMQQIADQVGVHVTTVSRAVDDKWVQTPRGIFPLKRFFGGGTKNDQTARTSPGRRSSRSCWKSSTRRTSRTRSPTRTWSTKLNEAGYPVARRTVTKYRKMLNIPSSRQRKDWSLAGD